MTINVAKEVSRKTFQKKDGTEGMIFVYEADNGVQFDSFTALNIGANEGELVPNENPQYRSRFKPAKKFGGVPGGGINVLKVGAMNNAVAMYLAGKIGFEKVEEAYKRFLKMMEG